MCKRLLVSFVVLLLAGTISFAANPVGIFDDTMDVGTPGNPAGIGIVQQLLGGGDNYRLTGGGSDVWDTEDHMLFAYKGLSGDWRMTADFQWQCANSNWSKTGVMIRASTAANSANFSAEIPNTWINFNDTYMHGRNATGEGSWENYHRWWATTPSRLGIQRFNILGPLSIVESLADFGSGWELLGSVVTTNLPQTSLIGAYVTSHDNNWMAQVNVSNVAYDQNPHMFTQITTIDNPGGNCMQTPGFKIYTVKKADGNWGSGDPAVYQTMNDLLDGKLPKGIGRTDFDEETGTFIDIYDESRLDPVVNLHDSGGRGNFGNDYSYPCVDVFEHPTADPANGDDDDNYATDASACIQLTAGYHVIGVNSDDGCIIKIGGVEIGRTGAWKGSSNVDFLFNVLTAGLYSFNARNLEGGGGSCFELYEYLADGSMILLGQQDDNGNFLGSPIYVPEPATVALLGFGGMTLLGIRRKR